MTSARSTVHRVHRQAFVLCLTGFVAGGCARAIELVNSADAGGTPEPEAGSAEDGGSDAALALCHGKPCACADGQDNDGDQLIDGFDPECSGPYDQDEASFATGEEKNGNPHCSDCFFDGNAGSGDDGCNVAASCALDGTAAGGTGGCGTCTASTRCIDNCLPRTPNGCDCFGCCEIVSGNSTVPVLLVDSCSLAVLDDESKCPRCKPSSACLNPCGRCELCAGKTPADLPGDCGNESAFGYSCDLAAVCASGSCEGQAYCVQGCCAPVLF